MKDEGGLLMPQHGRAGESKVASSRTRKGSSFHHFPNFDPFLYTVKRTVVHGHGKTDVYCCTSLSDFNFFCEETGVYIKLELQY